MSSFKLERLLWFHSNYVISHGDSVSIDDVCNRYEENFGDCQPRSIGNLLNKVFSGITVKQGRCKTNWRKKMTYYIGLKERPLQSDERIQFDKIPQFIPSGYFITATTDTCYEIGKFTGLVCNGNKVLLEIKINITGECEVEMMSTPIDVGFSTLELSMHSLCVFFAMMDNQRYCTGIAEEHLSQEENLVIQLDRDGNKVAYSMNCMRVLPYTQYLSSTVCSLCKKITVKTNPTCELNDPIEPVCDTDNSQPLGNSGNVSELLTRPESFTLLISKPSMLVFKYA